MIIRLMIMDDNFMLSLNFNKNDIEEKMKQIILKIYLKMMIAKQ
jgi:hypothetical protein